MCDGRKFSLSHLDRKSLGRLLRCVVSAARMFEKAPSLGPRGKTLRRRWLIPGGDSGSRRSVGLYPIEENDTQDMQSGRLRGREVRAPSAVFVSG
jgi:hypothetical protein